MFIAANTSPGPSLAALLPSIDAVGTRKPAGTKTKTQVGRTAEQKSEVLVASTITWKRELAFCFDLRWGIQYALDRTPPRDVSELPLPNLLHADELLCWLPTCLQYFIGVVIDIATL